MIDTKQLSVDQSIRIATVATSGLNTNEVYEHSSKIPAQNANKKLPAVLSKIEDKKEDHIYIQID